MKHLKDRPRPARIPANAPPTPPLEQIAERKSTRRWRVETEEVRRKVLVFTNEDAKALLVQAKDILEIHPESVDTAWHKWAKEVR